MQDPYVYPKQQLLRKAETPGLQNKEWKSRCDNDNVHTSKPLEQIGKAMKTMLRLRLHYVS
jgi:hypothetical protein